MNIPSAGILVHAPARIAPACTNALIWFLEEH